MRLKAIFKQFMLIMILFFAGDGIYGNGWWKVYFTRPGYSSRPGSDSPETALVRRINRADTYILGAFYDLRSTPVIDSFKEALKRGVEVRLVVERDNAGTEALHVLEEAGAGIVTDNRSGLMHNKFAIIDGKYLWTGSYNPTANGGRKNNNNAIVIYSTYLARIYFREFEEMYLHGIFGNRKEAGPFGKYRKSYYVKVEDTNINAYFAPEDNIERIILKRLLKAEKSIHFMAFSFTSDRLGEIMIKKFKEGIKVFGIFEAKGASSRYSEYVKMKIEGLPVRLDRNPHNMHHKVIVIDGERVITGSYNYSSSGNTKNDENILILDNAGIAREYLREFSRLYRR
jgi:phosphatidylserine/phosphatidylglycerophosphate/cardiolipin synthase-like enzyme